MYNRILLLCSLSYITLSLFAADLDSQIEVRCLKLPNGLSKPSHILSGCGAIIGTSPHYVASCRHDTGISIHDRKNRYAKLNWNLNKFKNIYMVKAVFLGDEYLATMENSSDKLLVTSTINDNMQYSYKVPNLENAKMITDFLVIPHNPDKILINCVPSPAVVFDLKQQSCVTKIEHDGYSMIQTLPESAGNGVWYLGAPNSNKAQTIDEQKVSNILGFWDFRQGRDHGPSTILETGYFRNASLVLSPDNQKCAIMCINEPYTREIRIFDLRKQKNDLMLKIIPRTTHTPLLSSLSFINNNNLFFETIKPPEPHAPDFGSEVYTMKTHKSAEKGQASIEIFVGPYQLEYQQNSKLFIGYPGAGIVHIFDPIYKL